MLIVEATLPLLIMIDTAAAFDACRC